MACFGSFSIRPGRHSVPFDCLGRLGVALKGPPATSTAPTPKCSASSPH